MLYSLLLLAAASGPPVQVHPVSHTPSTVADIHALQSAIRQVVRKSLPAVVAVQTSMGNNYASGSGVIVTPDGIIMTAGHVSGRRGTEHTVILSDGRRMKAMSLGSDLFADAGLLQIKETGIYPYAPIASVSSIKSGIFCINVGHPGGHNPRRGPVFRLGRLLDTDHRTPAGKSFLRTSAPVVHGDSGGPVFDIQGRVIGIHSEISDGLEDNFHVPLWAYTKHWSDKISLSEGVSP